MHGRRRGAPRCCRAAGLRGRDPKGTRNKYEYDPELGGIKFDRLLMSAATYPTDYGYLRGTLGQDGDPLDALVCLYEPTFPGCLIPVKPVGHVQDERREGHRRQDHLRAAARPVLEPYEELEDLPLLLRQEIEQFFSIYKDLEGKTVTDRRLALARGGDARDRSGAGAPAAVGRLTRGARLTPARCTAAARARCRCGARRPPGSRHRRASW